MGFLDKFKSSSNSKKEIDETSFEHLDNLIHSGEKEIVLKSDIILGHNEKSKYKNGIKIDVNDLVIIDGNRYTIDACGKTRIFDCIGKNIIIKNITLKNGLSKNGGAIINSGKLTIKDSILTNNTAKKEGGAISNEGELTITESTLIKNTAKKYGGAISNTSHLTILKSTLNENTVNANIGGAIYNIDGELTITESIFMKNTALAGGAIGSKGELTITESRFIKNTAENYGGAIINDAKLSIKDSILTNNTAKKEGGAIDLSLGTYEYESNNCTFKDNKPNNVYEQRTNFSW